MGLGRRGGERTGRSARHQFNSRVGRFLLQLQVFAQVAQKPVHSGCGRLWKTPENVTGKTIAQSQARTDVEVRSSPNASSQMSTG
jgi:hypothetical protein